MHKADTSRGVRAGARGVRVVGPSVIGVRVTIGEEAQINRSIVWDGASIGAGAVVSDTIVGMEYAVADRERIEGTIVANEPALSP